MTLRKPMKEQLKEARAKLQASEQQMARHLRVNLDTYIELERGGRMLPMPARKILLRRIDGLFKRCGLK